MQKHIKTLFTMVLAFAIILSMATGVLATEQEHDHNWVRQGGGGPRGHGFTCDGCGLTKIEDHTVDSSGNCTVCSYHIHIWQCAWSDDHWHCMVCSGCQEKKTVTHSKDSTGVCTVCGYTPHEHIWQYTQGENYAYNHGLHCTQCAATSGEDHIYGNDGKCTVCGNAPPHEHQWKWDGNKSNNIHDHVLACSCGSKTSEPHQLFAWDGKTGNNRGHSALCGICGFALLFDHKYDFNGERCTVCGYPDQGATVPETKPSETTPVETRPAESKPSETTPVETRPAESKPKETTPVETETAENQLKETEPSETKPEETKPAETEPEETMPPKAAKEGLQRSSSVWIWVATILVVVGGLGTLVFFLKKKSS